MDYDIFISYRREGGYETAKHLYDLLVRDGYKVSFDIDTLGKGDFNRQLFSRIKRCKDFILIVDPHAFDRTLDPAFNPKDDWMRMEIAYALNAHKNIVPVFLAGVSGFPKNLPPDIAGVTKINGPVVSMHYFDEFYRQLKMRFLHKRLQWPYIVISILIVILILLGAIIFLLQPKEPEDVQDQYQIGLMYFKGNDVERDYKKAFEWFSKAANAGNVSAKTKLGLMYLEGWYVAKDYQKAKAYFEEAASEHFDVAEYYLGMMYEFGHGVEVNDLEAIKWYRRAAMQGNDDAEYHLGEYYLRGEVVEQDYDEAKRLIEISAQKGNSYAQTALGGMYLCGIGGEQNYGEAEKWLLKSANEEEGDDEAQEMLSMLYYIQGRKSEAFKWIRKAAERDNAEAQYVYGVFYIKEKEANKIRKRQWSGLSVRRRMEAMKQKMY